MVLGVDRQPVLLRRGRDPVRDRPRVGDTIMLKPKVPVQSRRVVLLDDETRRIRRRGRTISRRLRRLLEVAFDRYGVSLSAIPVILSPCRGNNPTVRWGVEHGGRPDWVCCSPSAPSAAPPQSRSRPGRVPVTRSTSATPSQAPVRRRRWLAEGRRICGSWIRAPSRAAPPGPSAPPARPRTR